MHGSDLNSNSRCWKIITGTAQHQQRKKKKRVKSMFDSTIDWDHHIWYSMLYVQYQIWWSQSIEESKIDLTCFFSCASFRARGRLRVPISERVLHLRPLINIILYLFQLQQPVSDLTLTHRAFRLYCLYLNLFNHGYSLIVHEMFHHYSRCSHHSTIYM